MIPTYLWLFALGLGTGVVGGFLGIGGGVIITVVLLEWFKAQGLPVDLRFHLAFGTTLLAIFGTALSSTIAYQRMKRVVWPAVLPVGIGALLFSLAGSQLAAASSGRTLQTVFVVFCLVNAVLLVTRSPAADGNENRVYFVRCLIIGALAGTVSAYLGVAGGVVMVPLLMYWAKLPSPFIPGTSNAVGIVTCLVGAIGYMWSGSGAAQLPEGSWGFVVPSIAIPTLLGTLSGGPLGSLLNRRYGKKSFRYAFAVFLVAMALRVYFKG